MKSTGKRLIVILLIAVLFLFCSACSFYNKTPPNIKEKDNEDIKEENNTDNKIKFDSFFTDDTWIYKNQDFTYCLKINVLFQAVLFIFDLNKLVSNKIEFEMYLEKNENDNTSTFYRKDNKFILITSDSLYTSIADENMVFKKTNDKLMIIDYYVNYNNIKSVETSFCILNNENVFNFIGINFENNYLNNFDLYSDKKANKKDFYNNMRVSAFYIDYDTWINGEDIEFILDIEFDKKYICTYSVVENYFILHSNNTAEFFIKSDSKEIHINYSGVVSANNIITLTSIENDIYNIILTTTKDNIYFFNDVLFDIMELTETIYGKEIKMMLDV